MINLFSKLNSNKVSNGQLRPALQSLDDSLYPLILQNSDEWQNQQNAHTLNALRATYATPQDFLRALIDGDVKANQQAYWRLLYKNAIYQEWINFTVFGRYVQRSFSIFYQQNQDDFNADMPELLRHELMRHTQHLPTGQTLFFSGQLPRHARQEKLLITTLNPCKAYNDALLSKKVNKISNQEELIKIINQVHVKSNKVAGFAIKHNKHTSERLRCEVMILNFTQLRLVKEEVLFLKEEVLFQPDCALNTPTQLALRTYEVY